ncbi:hypothetical protein Acj133p057 [Acinetobacter phage 133]|uniref:Uncharacterized protein n=1 Tax=Acinetobacter phage 133 TaxID=2919552 RepID=D9I623_9CAUD|nr:hypothetical protein Acj133p057 [Acinetobacter phage 133]ADJ19404.1 hypothetical protein Acj133p057 [Acinetobacter phage 133]
MISHNINQVILNLQVLLDNKELIKKHAGKDLIRRLDIPGEDDPFYYRDGVCNNADFWVLGEYRIDKAGHAILSEQYNVLGITRRPVHDSMLEYLGAKFIITRNTGGSIMYPIASHGEPVQGKWLNEVRWDYVQFCLDELKYFVDNGKVNI